MTVCQTPPQPRSWTLLHQAVHDKDVSRILDLIADGGDIDSPASDGTGRTPLQLAALEGNLQIVECLLAHGASITEVGKCQYGWQPIHYACCGGDPAVITCLLLAGAQLDCRDAYGKTPRAIAVDHDCHHALSVLTAWQETHTRREPVAV